MGGEGGVRLPLFSPAAPGWRFPPYAGMAIDRAGCDVMRVDWHAAVHIPPLVLTYIVQDSRLHPVTVADHHAPIRALGCICRTADREVCL